MKSNNLATAKYIELVHELGRAHAFRSGWRGAAARELGISGSLLSQIENGSKPVTSATLQKAIEAKRLPADYFDLQVAPPTIPPPAPEEADPRPHVPTERIARAQDVVDPLLVLEAFRALPGATQKRLLGVLGDVVTAHGGHGRNGHAHN